MGDSTLDPNIYLPVEPANFAIETIPPLTGIYDLNTLPTPGIEPVPLLQLPLGTRLKPAGIVTHKVGPQYYLIDPLKPYGIRIGDCRRIASEIPDEPIETSKDIVSKQNILNYYTPAAKPRTTYGRRQLREGLYEPLQTSQIMFAKNPNGTRLYDFSHGIKLDMQAVSKPLQFNDKVQIAGSVTAADGTVLYVPADAWGNYEQLGRATERRGYFKHDLSPIYVRPAEPVQAPQPAEPPEQTMDAQTAEGAGTYQITRNVWAVNLKTMKPYKQVSKGAIISIVGWVSRGQMDYGRIDPMYFDSDKMWVGIPEYDQTTGLWNLIPVEHGGIVSDREWLERTLHFSLATFNRARLAANHILDTIFVAKYKK